MRRLKEESEFIREYDPGYEAAALGRTFADVIHHHEITLRARYDVLMRDSWPADPQTLQRSPQGTDPRLAYISIPKISARLLEELKRTRLVEHGRQGRVGWIGMHPKLAAVYMAALAEEVAVNRGYYPVSESPLTHLAVADWTIERIAQALLGDVHLGVPTLAEREVEAHIATMALSTIFPRNLAALPAEKIVELRQRSGVELAAFREYIHGLATFLSQLQVRSPEALQEHVDMEYEQRLKPQLDELRTISSKHGVETVTGALHVLLTAGPGAIPAAFGHGSTIVAAGAITLGFINVIRERRNSVRNDRRTSPAAYLLRLEEALEPPALMARVVQEAARFRAPIL